MVLRDTAYFVKTFGTQAFRHKERLFASLENGTGAFWGYPQHSPSSLTIQHYYGIYKRRHTVHARMLEDKCDEAHAELIAQIALICGDLEREPPDDLCELWWFGFYSGKERGICLFENATKQTIVSSFIETMTD